MSKLVLTALAGVAFAAGAQLQLPDASKLKVIDGVNGFATYSPIDNEANTSSPEFTGMSYDALAFGGTVTETNFNPGQFISEDYVSIQTDQDYLQFLRFVGGVSTVGDRLNFYYFNAGGNFVDGFSVAFGQAGLTFIWTITINSDVFVPKAGFLVIESAATNTGPANWRKKNVPPAIGTTTGDVFRWNMEVSDVPAPASLALLGLGGLAAARRRR
ncbi:MAG: PEP-CTERM sorting domain-containing protein [Phycisphaeraceae bacterium]|nr:PEP-CTERM sorting domain-containing protein [Phycisphaeraceae bacterium]MCW5755115.1 PEP-CTERM sorting domain-containing protein [Phycisphaeraceae bacterium]